MKQWCWKLRFRCDQVKCAVKLLGYLLRHRLHLEGDQEFYYHLQRELMRATLRADPQEEYLAEHGLLPDFEPEGEPEPEKEKEPGLQQEHSYMELLLCGVSLGDTTYITVGVKEYEDHTELEMQVVADRDKPVRTEALTMPHTDGARYDHFTLDGMKWRWDRAYSRTLLNHEAASYMIDPPLEETEIS